MTPTTYTPVISLRLGPRQRQAVEALRQREHLDLAGALRRIVQLHTGVEDDLPPRGRPAATRPRRKKPKRVKQR